MSTRQEENDIYIIPPNFIETGTIFGGTIKLRNAAEALLLSLLIGFPVFHLPATLTTKIIICCLTVLPSALFAIIGIDGESLSSFAVNFFIYRRNRRVVGLQADAEEMDTKTAPNKQKKKNTSEKKVKPRKEDFAEEFGQRKERRQSKQTKGTFPHKDRRAAKRRDHAAEEQEPSLLNPAASYLPIRKIENGIIYTKDHRYVKKLLLSENPARFSFYLSGSSDTNRPRSDIPRRLRLQLASIAYAMLQGAGVEIFRDRKAPLFQQGTRTGPAPACNMTLPAFYHSREVKELGAEAVKINNSRTTSILLAPECIYAVFCTGGALMKWEYRTELKVKALLSYHASRGILSGMGGGPRYHPDTPIKALIIGEGMDTALKLMESTGGFQKSYFYLDSSFDFFHYIPDDAAGITMIRLLCSPARMKGLKNLLLSDLQPPCSDYGLEHDALWDSCPVLLAYDFDMLRISRFRTALSLHDITGHLICFDFQKAVLKQYFRETVSIETIDLKKFEGRFLQ